jgi:pimeloyl-ACP methyl ester carboxylesterase
MKFFKFFASFFLIIFLALFFLNVFLESSQETLELNSETRKKLSGSFIKLPQGVTHYEITGSDTGKVMVLIHGGGNASFIWDKNVPYLVKNGFKILRYDLYGRGYSDRPDTQYDLNLFHSQLSALLDTLHLEKEITMVGSSMGAMIAIDFTLKHPEKVANLILIDPAALNSTHIMPLLRMPLLSDLYIAGYYYPKMIDKQMHEFYNPAKVKEYADKCAPQMKYKGFKKAVKSTRMFTLNVNMENEIVKVGKQHTNTLLLWGKYDPLVDCKISQYYKQAIPDLKYVEIDSAGHIANYEQPDIINREILNFVQCKSHIVSLKTSFSAKYISAKTK